MASHIPLAGVYLRFVRFHPHERLDGETTQINVWEITCATCREPFEITSASFERKMLIDLGRLTRRCPECRPAPRKPRKKPTTPGGGDIC